SNTSFKSAQVVNPVHPVEPEMSETTKPGWLSFSIRDLLWLTALVAVVLWGLYSKPAAPVAPGRYIFEKGNEQAGETFLVDTATGECWVRNISGNWYDATPSGLKKHPQ